MNLPVRYRLVVDTYKGKPTLPTPIAIPDTLPKCPVPNCSVCREGLG